MFTGGWVAVLLTLTIAQAATSVLKKAGMRKAAPVIRAAEQFRESQGRYPGRIEELVPAWLEKVPDAAMLGTAPYRLATHYNAFVLSFELPHWEQCTYSSDTGIWVVHD